MCDPSAILILPPDGKQWMCDRPFNSSAITKFTKCYLTCNDGFEVVQGEFSITYAAVNQSFFSEGKREFHKCGGDGEWQRPDKVNQTCRSKCK